MPIWPMPKSYTRGHEVVSLDYYNFQFIPDRYTPDMVAAIRRFHEEIFGGNVAAPSRADALSKVYIRVEDYNAPLNVCCNFPLSPSLAWTKATLS